MLGDSINLLSILIAGITSSILGWLWFSKFTFVRKWVKIKDSKKEKISRKRSIALSFLITLFIAFMLSLFIDYYGAKTIWQGIGVGFQIWLGFIATITLMPVIYEEGSFKIYLLNNSYYLLSCMIMGAILTF